MVAGLNGNIGDYDKFYHNVDGKMVKHSEVHNLYGMNMTRSAFEALQEYLSGKANTLLLSFLLYWCTPLWWHLAGRQQILVVAYSPVHAAAASFKYGWIPLYWLGYGRIQGCDTTEDLMIRWLQYSLFTPLFRNHSADGYAGTRRTLSVLQC